MGLRERQMEQREGKKERDGTERGRDMKRDKEK